jgi:hypothetical protein
MEILKKALVHTVWRTSSRRAFGLVITVFLLIPWSRVLLEKLTRKLCS